MNVLVVEDDADIATMAASFLEVYLTETPSIRVRTAAHEVTDDDLGWADAVLADQNLPGVNGCDVLCRAAEVNPKARLVLWTAGLPAVCPAAHVSLCKPVSMDTLVAALRG